MGGREAELLLLDDLSIGSQRRPAAGDRDRPRPGRGVRHGRRRRRRLPLPADDREPRPLPHLSPAQLEALDRRVREMLEEARQRAASILKENRALVETLRDLLLEKKVIDAKTLGELVAK